MSRPEFASYRDFFPYYVAMHSKPLTRQLHFGGTLAGALLALLGLVTRRPKMIALFPLSGYGTAWPAHWLVEKNNPASFGVFPNVLEAIKTAIRKQLGDDFKFEFNESINPVTGNTGSSAIE